MLYVIIMGNDHEYHIQCEYTSESIYAVGCTYIHKPVFVHVTIGKKMASVTFLLIYLFGWFALAFSEQKVKNGKGLDISKDSARTRRADSTDECNLNFNDVKPLASVYYFKPSGNSKETHRVIQPLWINDTLIVVTQEDGKGSHLYKIEKTLNWVLQDKTKYVQNIQIASSSLTLSPADDHVAFLLSLDRQRLFLTRDAGNTWSNVWLPTKADMTFYHPRKSSDILILGFQSKQVYLSTDYGKTWNGKLTNVLKMDWDLNTVSNTVEYVYYLQDDSTSDPHSHTLSRAEVTNLANKQILLEHVYTFVVDGRFLFITKVNSSDTTNHTRLLYTSADHGVSFRQAHIPAINFSQSYIVLKTHEAGAFLHFIDKGNTRNGTLYVGDSSATHFTVSLEGHFYYHNIFSIHDFYEVLSVKGVYLTSVYLPNKKMRTKITFDNGDKWNNLTCTQCKSLNLHMDFSTIGHAIKSMYIQGPLSHSTAPGLILANGMLEDIPAGEVNTVNVTLTVTKTHFVMSEDGGETWQRPKNISSPGFFVYGIFDYGNAIAVLQTNSDRPTMWFSHNRGKCFYSVGEDSGDFLPKSFLPVPNALDKKGAVFGKMAKEDELDNWVYLVIDMNDFLGRPCIGSDYRLWRTSGSNCILGGKYTYNITKDDSVCFSTKDYSPKPVNATNCQCSQYTDFECAYGYIRNHKTLNCTKMEIDDKYKLENLCPSGANEYNYSKYGYARVPGDICTGGSDSLLEIKKGKCMGYETDSGEGYTNSIQKFFTEDSTGKIVGAIIVVVVAILCLAAGIYIIYRCRKGKKSDERVNYSRVPQDDPEMEPLMSSKTPVGGRNEEEDDEEMLNADPTTLKV